MSFQISMAPGDWRHADALLRHQLRQWAGQVDEVVVTVDGHRSRGRFSQDWQEGQSRITAIIAEAIHPYPHARMVEVDYGDSARRAVADRFFGGCGVPVKDYRGGPFYAYFFALHVARHDLVFHSDSDLFYGGGSQQWIAEAVDLFRRHDSVLCCSPLPGPPTVSGWLTTQESEPCGLAPGAHSFRTMSTRLFLVRRSRLTERLCPLSLEPPSLRNRLKAAVEGHPPFRLPESIVSQRMAERDMVRVDFLGGSPGMWSLHPPYRTESFYASLPRLVARVEIGDVPEAQRGDYDMNDSMVDWSPARAALSRNRWWRRLPGRR